MVTHLNFLSLILSLFHLLFSFFAINLHQCLLLAGVETIGTFSLFLMGGIPFTIHSICNSMHFFNSLLWLTSGKETSKRTLKIERRIMRQMLSWKWLKGGSISE